VGGVDRGRVAFGFYNMLALETGRFFPQYDERWSFWHG
jgi:hypothetical protein